MNKMNLPCPLVSFVRTSRPPLPTHTATNQARQNVPKMSEAKSATESSSESEIETDTEANLKRVSTELKNKSMPKRLKLQSFLKTNVATVEESKNKIELEKVFEKPGELKEDYKTKVATNPNEYDRKIIESNKDSFGKIIPINKQPSEVIYEEESKEQAESNQFITQNELEKNRLKIAELKELPVYKNYDKGEPSSKLYLKNLTKGVQESDLKRIYGRYVDWNDEQSVSAFEIRLMKEGRMKGQAFITYANEQSAEKALSETNGYVLLDKPIIVSFAKSAKPK